MRNLLLAGLLALAACTSTPRNIPTTPPAPLAHTVIDEKGLIATYAAFDTLLTAVDTLIAVKVIVPGTEPALRIKLLIERAQAALKAASAARRAGSAASYGEALAEARAAFLAIRQSIKGE